MDESGSVADPQDADTPNRPDAADDNLTPDERARVHQAGKAIGDGVADAFEEFPADGPTKAKSVPAVVGDEPDNGSRMPSETPAAEEPAGEEPR